MRLEASERIPRRRRGGRSVNFVLLRGCGSGREGFRQCSAGVQEAWERLGSGSAAAQRAEGAKSGGLRAGGKGEEALGVGFRGGGVPHRGGFVLWVLSGQTHDPLPNGGRLLCAYFSHELYHPTRYGERLLSLYLGGVVAAVNDLIATFIAFDKRIPTRLVGEQGTTRE